MRARLRLLLPRRAGRRIVYRSISNTPNAIVAARCAFSLLLLPGGTVAIMASSSSPASRIMSP